MAVRNAVHVHGQVVGFPKTVAGERPRLTSLCRAFWKQLIKNTYMNEARAEGHMRVRESSVLKVSRTLSPLQKRK